MSVIEINNLNEKQKSKKKIFLVLSVQTVLESQRQLGYYWG